MPFTILGLSDTLTKPLARLGYTTPTPVQTQSIPIVLDGSDLLARAQTGTGKTAAFGLPMIDRLLVRNRRRPGALAASCSCRRASWRSRFIDRSRTTAEPPA
jgi:ATP-dependent RNA helicase RhlE